MSKQSGARTASVARDTQETKITVELNLDGTGTADIATGVDGVFIAAVVAADVAAEKADITSGTDRAFDIDATILDVTAGVGVEDLGTAQRARQGGAAGQCKADGEKAGFGIQCRHRETLISGYGCVRSSVFIGRCADSIRTEH